jgi:hypothetical protein
MTNKEIHDWNSTLVSASRDIEKGILPLETPYCIFADCQGSLNSWWDNAVCTSRKWTGELFIAWRTVFVQRSEGPQNFRLGLSRHIWRWWVNGKKEKNHNQKQSNLSIIEKGLIGKPDFGTRCRNAS